MAEEKNDTFRIRPWMGVLGLLGFLGFLNKPSGYPATIFFVLFSLFSLFFLGNIEVDDSTSYKEDERKAKDLLIYMGLLLIVFILVLMDKP